MKIGIVTVYNSINSGSFWQAKALEEYLKNNGHTVYFIKRKKEEKGVKLYFQVLKKFVKYNLKEAIRYLNMIKEFKKSQSIFKIIDINEVSELDLIIYGSDTLWNIKNKYFAQNYQRYFGKDISDIKKITYAISVGDTGYHEFIKYKDIPECIKVYNALSVRDNSTFEIVKKLTGIESDIVCDPTLLLDFNEYKSRYINPFEKDKYIFLYLFKDLDKEMQKLLLDFSKKNGYKIISGVRKFAYTDKTIVNTPDMFLNYMLYADYVITDTFHGTVFSINFNKQFVSINYNKKKVNDFIERVKLNNRLINNQNDLINVLTEKINYKECNEILFEIKEKSKIFLNKQIG